VRRVLQGREGASGNGGFVWQNNQIAGIPAQVTTNLPAGSLVIGPWNRIFVSVWGAGFTLEINPFEPSNFKSGVIQARIILSCDVAVRQAAAFVWATSVS